MHTSADKINDSQNNSAGIAQNKPRTALSLPAVPVLQQKTGITNVVQRVSFEDFDTYDEAKAANPYAAALLDEQKDDPIEEHFKKGFDAVQQSEIYRINKATYGQDHIISDGDGTTPLTKPDTKFVAHIDHRYPKSKGGSNHYTNAAVIAANANIKKSDKLEIDEEPSVALAPYRYLAFDSAFAKGKVGAHMDFSAEQRKAILDANSGHYGEIKSDADGKTKLGRLDTTRIPHIDHITAKGEGGTNYYFNAKVLPASENIQKSGAKGRDSDIDYRVGSMSLVKYYDKKARGKISTLSAIEHRDAD